MDVHPSITIYVPAYLFITDIIYRLWDMTFFISHAISTIGPSANMSVSNSRSLGILINVDSKKNQWGKFSGRDHPCPCGVVILGTTDFYE